MKFSKFLVYVGVAAILTFSIPGAEAPAFENPGSANPQPATLYDPELWGVIVVDCLNNTATLRVKMIDGENCEVKKQAEIDLGFDACPDTNNAALYYRFPYPGVNLFQQNRQAVITKIRNWEATTTSEGRIVYSFDAQIKFTDPPPQQ